MKKEELPATGACKDINFLPDDTSLTGQTDCLLLKIGNNLSSAYHFHLIFKSGMYHIILANLRFECDDKYDQTGYTHAGSWLFFARYT